MQARLTQWYSHNARDLPWRRAHTSAWGVLVSEVMLQQTPVGRVVPAYLAWMDRWATPAQLAADTAGEAVRHWGRLGYPRRALRLHAAATYCVARHDGRVPSRHAELLALPGVGPYTAAAVASFAFQQRHAVLDTNVRRVYARLLDGRATPSTASPSARERLAAERLLPPEPAAAAAFSVAVMELGALVCQSRAPRCGSCPIAPACSWLLSGRPTATGHPRGAQPYAGSDREVRGRLLAMLRERPQASRLELDAVWRDSEQRERALASLVADGLIETVAGDHFRLPA